MRHVALGIKRATLNIKFEQALSQEDYDKYKDYDFKKDSPSPSGVPRDPHATISTMQPWQKLTA